MGQTARVVIPGSWHHVIQRGNRSSSVFLNDADRQLYLDLLRTYCTRYQVQIAGYCLSMDHAHLLAIPENEAGLAQAIGRAHYDYARWHNLRHRQTGHLWQKRFLSCPVDEADRWDALRYVELNPVRAGIVRCAEAWPWSSACAHVSGYDPANLLTMSSWEDHWAGQTWRESLEQGFPDPLTLERILEATQASQPVRRVATTVASADFDAL